MSDSKTELRGLVEKLAGRRILVLGDFVLDRYLLTRPSRLSREAPVMITRFEGEQDIPGGAANAVNNLLALGATVIPVGLLGVDEAGEKLHRHFAAAGVEVDGLIAEPSYATITKTRVMVGDANRMKQQVLRIDREPPAGPSERANARILDALRRGLRDSDAVLVSDYGYGLVHGAVIDTIRGGIAERILTADSRYLITSYRGATLATPNEGEAEAAVGFAIGSVADLDRAGQILLKQLEAEAVLITRGNRGMALFEREKKRVDIAATGEDQVVDVSGAGDTVIAVATLALAAGASFEQASRLANIAAGVVVMKLGAATSSPSELRQAVERHA